MFRIRPASAGYEKLLLWVFDNNLCAIRFYESQGFTSTGWKRPGFGAVEEMYLRVLQQA